MPNGPDPRTRVTPDAFAIADDVLGLPLGSPWRRLFAFAIDGIGVGLLTLLDWRILGVLAAVVFFRLATRKPAANRIGKTFQLSVGCAGAFILFMVVIVSTGLIGRLLTSAGSSALTQPADTEVASDLGWVGALQGLGAAVELLSADNDADAEEAGVALALRLIQLDSVDAEGAMEALEEIASIDVAWHRRAVLDRIRSRILGGPVTQPTLDTVPLPAALLEYAAVAGAEAPPQEDGAERREALRRRIASAVAADTLSRLDTRIADLQDELDSSEAALQTTQQALSESEESKGPFAWLMELIDQLGLTFGWGAIYFSTLMSLMSGQTPGKRILGIRVVRLDGNPLGWYLAFERTGGYAAGLATGLLGFAQLLWDPNRQAIHDKIAGTVVVRVVPGVARTAPSVRNPETELGQPDGPPPQTG